MVPLKKNNFYMVCCIISNHYNKVIFSNFKNMKSHFVTYQR